MQIGGRQTNKAYDASSIMMPCKISAVISSRTILSGVIPRYRVGRTVESQRVVLAAAASVVMLTRSFVSAANYHNQRAEMKGKRHSR